MTFVTSTPNLLGPELQIFIFTLGALTIGFALYAALQTLRGPKHG